MKLIIAGSREFNDYNLLEKSIIEFIKELDLNISQIEIVSGGARGADKLGEIFATKNNLKIHLFIPEWDRLGKSAGYVRNEQMAKNADACICFWDGISRGTQHMINISNNHNLKLKIINYGN